MYVIIYMISCKVVFWVKEVNLYSLSYFPQNEYICICICIMNLVSQNENQTYQLLLESRGTVNF